jgi:hypothetical protein
MEGLFRENSWRAFLHMNLETQIPDRLYVIGDIHGRSDLLDRIVEAITRDLKQNRVDKCLTVTLGDYIDRGPDSRGVLDRLIRNPFPCEYIPLKGNHEALFETFLIDPSVAQHWRRLGGLETLVSYRVPVRALMMGKGYEQAAEALKAAVHCLAANVATAGPILHVSCRSATRGAAGTSRGRRPSVDPGPISPKQSGLR